MSELEEFLVEPAQLRHDAIAHAWASMHPRIPLPPELRWGADVCTALGSLWKRVRSGRPLEAVLERLVGAGGTPTPAPRMIAATDAELDAGKYLGDPCPSGHRVRYRKTKQCVMCLRAAVKRCNDRDRAKAA